MVYHLQVIVVISYKDDQFFDFLTLIDVIALSQKRNAKKEASERKYYAEKKYVSGD